MGGRGAHLDRNEDGTLKVKEWKTVEVFVVSLENRLVSVRVLERDNSSKPMALPGYSNKPNEIYAMRDPITGIISRIRLYDEKCKGYLDLEYHGKSFNQIPFYHKHFINYEAKTKRERGHAGEHLPITSDDQIKYKELLEMLNT